jgi:hypothetical protein
MVSRVEFVDRDIMYVPRDIMSTSARQRCRLSGKEEVKQKSGKTGSAAEESSLQRTGCIHLMYCTSIAHFPNLLLPTTKKSDAEHPRNTTTDSQTLFLFPIQVRNPKCSNDMIYFLAAVAPVLFFYILSVVVWVRVKRKGVLCV